MLREVKNEMNEVESKNVENEFAKDFISQDKIHQFLSNSPCKILNKNLKFQDFLFVIGKGIL